MMRLPIVLLLILGACGVAGRERRLDGDWVVQLKLDPPYQFSGRTVRPLTDTTSGVIYLSPAFRDFPEWAPVPREMRPYAVGRYFIDFGPLFGRAPQPDSARPRPGLEFESGSWQEVLARIPRGSRVSIDLTPRVNDTGFSLAGRLRADTITGSWVQHTIGGTGAHGHFRMVRRPRTPQMDSAIAYARRGSHRPLPEIPAPADTVPPAAVPLPAAGDTAMDPVAAPR